MLLIGPQSPASDMHIYSHRLSVRQVMKLEGVLYHRTGQLLDAIAREIDSNIMNIRCKLMPRSSYEALHGDVKRLLLLYVGFLDFIDSKFDGMCEKTRPYREEIPKLMWAEHRAVNEARRRKNRFKHISFKPSVKVGEFIAMIVELQAAMGHYKRCRASSMNKRHASRKHLVVSTDRILRVVYVVSRVVITLLLFDWYLLSVG